MIRKITSFILAIILTAGMAVSMTSCGAVSVDLNQYLTISSEGYEGSGTASFSINKDQLISDFTGKISLTSEGKNSWRINTGVQYGEDPAELVAEALSGSLSSKSGLSNGDTITFTWDIDQSIEKFVNIELEYSSEDYTVSNLKEVTEYDAFEGVTVSFSGISPEGEAVLTVPSGNPISSSAYTLTRVEGLSNGDTVTVSINSAAVQDAVENSGMVPAETSMDFVVEGLGYYVTDLDQIPADSLSKAADYIGRDYMDTKNKDWESEYIWPVTGTLWETNGRERTMDSIDYLGSYLYVSADRMSNDLTFIYKINGQQLGYSAAEEAYVWVPVEYYWFAECPDVFIRDDGTCKLDYTQYEAPTTGEVSLDITQNQIVPVGGNMTTGTVTYVGFKDLDSLEQYLDDVQEGTRSGSTVGLEESTEETDETVPGGEEQDNAEAEAGGTETLDANLDETPEEAVEG